MLDQPRFPLFVFGDNEALVFLNQRDVGVFVERDDVADGVYHGFDFDGRALHFGIKDDGIIVYCRLASGQPQHDQLMRELREYLARYEEYQPDGDDAIAKTLAAGLFMERHIEYPTILGWLKSLIRKKQK